MNPDAKSEVLRYLGYHGQELSPELAARVDAAMAECRAVTRARHTLRRFPLVPESNGLRLAESDVLLSGKQVARRLAGAKEAVLLAATLGTEIETCIHRHQHLDMAYALMLDAAASQRIEEICDAAEDALRAQLVGEALCLGRRFSPGYGDLPLSLQAPLLALLDAPRRIGLTCTASFLLTPRKSITALLGLFAGEAPSAGHGCAYCSISDRCGIRKR